MITVINYGLGNITAFVNVYKRLNVGVKVASVATDIPGATHLILPGVGAFDHAMDLFNASGMRDAVEGRVSDGVPVLGICVGMQILADSSEEGSASGLGWVAGRVRSFASHPAASQLPLPHMGWNDVRAVGEHPLFRGLEQDARFYFLHSYYFDSAAPEAVAATAAYGVEFPCAVRNSNVWGVQCHPEKSHHWGAALLKNFSEL